MKHLINLGPWLVALAPAWFVFDVLINEYGVIEPVAVATAIGVELTGVAAYHTATRLYSWNRRKRKSDPAAPTWAAAIAIAVYLIAGAILTAVIKGDWSLALFFALAAAGYTTVALNIDQDAREERIAKIKAEKRTRRTSVNATANDQPPTNDPQPTAERSTELDERLADVQPQLGERSFKRADVQQATGLDKTAAANLVRYGIETGQLEQAGRHQYKFTMNGKGPE